MRDALIHSPLLGCLVVLVASLRICLLLLREKRHVFSRFKRCYYHSLQFLLESNGPLSLNSITARLCSQCDSTVLNVIRGQFLVAERRILLSLFVRQSKLYFACPHYKMLSLTGASSIEPINLLLDDPGTFVWLRQRNNFLV